MFEPEIARRCLSCGATVRQRASFCPQCGQLVEKQLSDSDGDSQTTPVEGPETQIIVSPSLGNETQILAAPSEGAETQILAAPSEGGETQILAAPELPPIASESPEATAVTQIDLVLPEELRPHPLPMAPETQPLITQTIQREPAVSEADKITPHAADVARPDTEHNLMDRVARIREVSSVVIDQAAYDPSLRFLLVAAVLFILFLVLMILSKVIG